MIKKILFSVIASVIATAIISGVKLVFGDRNQTAVTQQYIYTPANLRITGSNNKLYIFDNERGIALKNTTIMGSNHDSEIGLPKNQQLLIHVLGSNNEIKINRSVFPQVTVMEFGANNNVSKSLVGKFL